MKFIKSPIIIGILSVSLGSILLGSIGIFVRFANNNIEPMTQTFLRIFIPFILISLLNGFRKKLKTETLAIKKSDLPFFFLNGLVGFSVMASTFTLAVLYTSITNTYFLLYTAPIFAVIFSIIFLKDKISKDIVISIIIGLVGLSFLFEPTNLTKNLFGNLLGLITGISFGTYFVLTGYLGKKYNAPTITFWTQLFGSIGIFPLIFIFDKKLNIPFDFNVCLPVILAGIIVFLGYILLNYGLTKIKPSIGSILSLFEPLSSIVFGIIFFLEFPSKTVIIGACFIVLSIIYLTYSQTKKSTDSPM